MGPLEYRKYLNSYFSICNKYKLDAIEKKVLITQVDIRNKNGESLLYSYLIKKACDVGLIEQMLENGYYLNDQDYYDIFVKLFEKNFSKTKWKREKDKVFWLIDKMAKQNQTGSFEFSEKITQYVLVGRHFYSNNKRQPHFLDLLKKLHSVHLLVTDRDVGFKPIEYFSKLEDWKWFDEHFTIDWTTHSDSKYFTGKYYDFGVSGKKVNRLLYYFSMAENIEHVKNIEKRIKFLLEKDPLFIEHNLTKEVVTDVIKMISSPYNISSGLIFLKNFYTIIELLNYKPNYLKDMWLNVLQRAVSQFNYDELEMRNVLLFGIYKGEIDCVILDPGIIKRFGLNVEMIKNLKKKGKIYK